MARLPSFNDFSPGLIPDIRVVLRAVESFSENNDLIASELLKTCCVGWDAKRVRTNIPATLRSTGLVLPQRSLRLSDFGESVLAESTPVEAATAFCAGIIDSRNGFLLLQAIENLRAKGEKTTKATLQVELERLGVTDLSNATTDHTTLKNWMVFAGLIVEAKGGYPAVNNDKIKAVSGISFVEHDELQSLTPAQRVFVRLVRRRAITEPGPFFVDSLLSECRSTHQHLFTAAAAQFAKQIGTPLEVAGWVVKVQVPKLGRGGNSGALLPTPKLLGIAEKHVYADFDTAVPADLQTKLRTPLSQIKVWLDGTDTYEGGLGLELLALRIILDLRLAPRGFRVRSRETAHAEVDVTAEGDHLLFSRWTFQCKRVQAATNVGLGDVAKEVGLAIYMKAHVIVMVSTGGFTSAARSYAKEITKATHLQFVFLSKEVIDAYLADGAGVLHEHVMNNAREVMLEKRDQPITT